MVDVNYGLTTKQKKVYAAIEQYTTEKGIPPTVRELGMMIGEKTPGAVQGILNRLHVKGVISRQNGAARSIKIVQQVDSKYLDLAYLPELKVVSSRNKDKLFSVHNIAKYHPVSPDMHGNVEGRFICRAVSNVLDSAGIHTGDMLMVDTYAAPANGDIILVEIQDRVYLRKYIVSESRITLSDDIYSGDYLLDTIKVIGTVYGHVSASKAVV